MKKKAVNNRLNLTSSIDILKKKQETLKKERSKFESVIRSIYENFINLLITELGNESSNLISQHYSQKRNEINAAEEQRSEQKSYKPKWWQIWKKEHSYIEKYNIIKTAQVRSAIEAFRDDTLVNLKKTTSGIVHSHKKELEEKCIKFLLETGLEDIDLDETDIAWVIRSIINKITLPDFKVYFPIPKELQSTGELKNTEAEEFKNIAGACIKSFRLEVDKTYLSFLGEIRSDLNELSISDTIFDKLDRYINGLIERIKNEYNLLKEKYYLLSLILSANTIQNEFINKFHSLIFEDYMNFANSEDALDSEAGAFNSLLKIEKDLSIISENPSVFLKHIVAIGGGFSSGKTELINSFMDSEYFSLPVAITPTTAIPTYVTHSADIKIIGFSDKGGCFELPPELYNNFNHNYIKQFDFDIRTVMPYTSVNVPFKNEFNKICFIDTPGYNAAGGKESFTEKDNEISHDWVKRARFVVWAISITKGTINVDDLKYLEDLHNNDLKIYVICTNADKRNESEIEEILDEVAAKLEDYISYEGISAYSSIEKKEYGFRKKGIHEYFESLSKEKTDIAHEVRSDIDQVVAMYRNAISQEREKLKEYTKILNKIKGHHKIQTLNQEKKMTELQTEITTLKILTNNKRKRVNNKLSLSGKTKKMHESEEGLLNLKKELSSEICRHTEDLEKLKKLESTMKEVVENFFQSFEQS